MGTDTDLEGIWKTLVSVSYGEPGLSSGWY
jgi:hypothetical protein